MKVYKILNLFSLLFILVMIIHYFKDFSQISNEFYLVLVSICLYIIVTFVWEKTYRLIPLTKLIRKNSSQYRFVINLILFVITLISLSVVYNTSPI